MIFPNQYWQRVEQLERERNMWIAKVSGRSGRSTPLTPSCDLPNDGVARCLARRVCFFGKNKARCMRS